MWTMSGGERQSEREQRAKELAEEQLEKKESRGEDEAEEGERKRDSKNGCHTTLPASSIQKAT